MRRAVPRLLPGGTTDDGGLSGGVPGVVQGPLFQIAEQPFDALLAVAS